MRYLTLTLLVCLFAASAPFGHRPGMRHMDATSLLFSAQRADRIDTDRYRSERVARGQGADTEASGAVPVNVSDGAL